MTSTPAHLQIFFKSTTTLYSESSTEATSIEGDVVEDVTTKNDIIAAVVIFVVGLCGITGNITAIRIITRVPSLHNCFGYLLLLHAIAEAGVLFIFIFWAAPITVFNQSVSYTLVGIKLGHIILVFYFITLYCQVMKSLNRLTAIAMPISYRSYFRNENIKFVLAIVIGISLCHGVVYFFDGCNFYFDGNTYIWTFDSTPCGNVISYYIDFMYGSSLMIVIILIDACTFIFIQKGSRLIDKGNMKSRKEIQFFIQACSTSLLYSLMLLSFHLVWRIYSDPWIVFASTTLAWELCHALDGTTSMENPVDPSSLLTTMDPRITGTQTDQYIAVSIIFTVGVCGLIANTTAIRIIWKSKNLHNCFGYLLLLHASAEALVLCAFVFWAVPVTLFNRSLSKTTLGLKVGQAVVVSYYGTLYVQIFKATNRLLAIASPITYRRWFSDENSKFILAAVITCSLLHMIPLFIPGCAFFYDAESFTWNFDSTPCFNVGMCGIIADIIAIRVVWKSKSLHNCFGYLLIIQAVGGGVNTFCLVVWSVPVALFDTSLSKTTLGFKIGQVMTVFYYITIYVQLAKAINRFVAIFSPVIYRKWFSNENSKFILGGVVFFSLLHGALYSFPGCNFYFDGDRFTWTYDDTPCYDIMAFYTDFIIGWSVIGLTMLIDTCTLCKIMKSKLFTGKNNKEVKFFIQTFTTSILYTVVLIISHVFANFSKNEWYVFGTTTLNWELCEVIDGLLNMAFTDSQIDYLPTTAMNSEDEENDSDRYIAASIMFAVGVCGLIANTTAIRIIWRSKNLHNCFGYLLLLHASAEALVLCAFVFWAVPVTLFDRSISKSTLGMKIGQVVMVFYYVTLYVQLFKSTNRLLAISSPITYRRWFSDENSKFILAVIVFFSLLHGGLYFFPGCNFYFDGYWFNWIYDETSCYDIMNFYVDFIIGCSIMGITMLTDSCTLCLIIKHGLFSGKSNKEVKFFIQAFSTSILYTIMLITVQILSKLNDNIWYIFGATTFTWEMCHAIDG
ncbi:hypothetical protein FO519_008652 [Halicephalobus sp. NKZ332]|nr:hypothetical protein FO519_008652 [Halicephalobus sp. NKZ332]